MHDGHQRRWIGPSVIEVNTDGTVDILAADSTPLPEPLRKDLLTLGKLFNRR